MKSVLTPVLVGRTQELGQLETALATSQGGAGQCVVVRGEAGIGKSRLLAEIRSHAIDRGFLALEGRCFEQDVCFPYAPLIDMLRTFFARRTVSEILDSLGPLAPEFVKLLPELPPDVSELQPTAVLEPEARKRRLFEALAQFLLRRADTQPLLIVVEDLHWSDDASLEFLLFLARRIAAYPILLLLSCRSEETHARLVHLLTGLDREQIAHEIRLNPLTRSEVGMMLRALLDLRRPVQAEFVDAIYELTDGNPFFVEETFTSLIAAGDIYYADGRWDRKPLQSLDIPRSLQRIVQQRVGQLGETARQLVDLAAVSGRSFDFAVLRGLTGHTERQLLALIKELIAAQLVVEESTEQFAFRHALTREALYARLLARERQALHGQIAQATEQIHAASLDAHLEDLAYHFYEAGMWAKALSYAQRAGKKAQALYAPRAAAEQFTRALDAAGQLPVSPPVELYRMRGQVYETLGDFEQARADFEVALQAARAARDQRGEWQALLDLSMLWASRDYTHTGDYCQQALALARAIGDPSTLGHSLNRAGNWYLNSNQPLEALAYYQEALDIFEELNDRHGTAATLDLMGMARNFCGDPVQAIAYYERAISMFRELDDRQGMASSLASLSYLGPSYLERGQEAVELAREINWRSGEAYALLGLVVALSIQGHYGEALAAASRSLEIAEEIEHRQWMTHGYVILGMLYVDLLALTEAQRHLEKGLALAKEISSMYMLHLAMGSLASACILQDKLEQAGALLDEVLDPRGLELGGTAQWWVEVARAELALAHENAELVLQLSDDWLKFITHDDVLTMEPYTQMYMRLSNSRGQALALLERYDEAEAMLHAAQNVARAQDVRPWLWRIHLSLGKLYRAASRPERAKDEFLAARTIIDELGDVIPRGALRDRFLRRARAMIPPVRPLTPRQAVKREFGGLTARERQVAAVVAQGKSNRQIADELVVSVKTVEAHISRILSKLGFSSRAQIAAWAVERGLASAPLDLDSRQMDET